MITGTLVLACWCGHSLTKILALSMARTISQNNIYLMVIILLILVFSSQMKLSGMMSRLVTSVKGLVSPKAAVALLPALIGLLPMPGGAIFSAPLVDSADHTGIIHPVKKTAINFWFRHIWEYWWPLYPGVILAAEISGISLYSFVLFMFPLSLFSVLGGGIFLLKNIEKRKQNNNHHQEHVNNLFYALSPLIIVIGITLLFKIITGEIFAFNRYLPILIGSLAGIIFLGIRNPLAVSTWLKVIFSTKTVQMILLVAVIRIFGAFIEARLPDGILLMEKLQAEFTTAGIPALLMIMGLPFICGLTTGIAVGFVGASFPIIMTFIGDAPSSARLISTVVLAYGFGYMGMILSPVHVCLIVSNQYFKTGINESLIKLLKPATVVLSGALLLFMLYRTIL